MSLLSGSFPSITLEVISHLYFECHRAVPAEKLAESHAVHPSLLVCLLVFSFTCCILKPIIKTNLLDAFVEKEHSRHGVDFLIKMNERSKICTKLLNIDLIIKRTSVSLFLQILSK